MRFLIDEQLSPTLAEACHRAGYEATCVRDRDMLGAVDRELAALCLEEERVLATNNAGDFLDLAEQAGLHPGLAIMPLGSRSQERSWIRAIIEHIERLADAAQTTPAELMINSVIEVDEGGVCKRFEYP